MNRIVLSTLDRLTADMPDADLKVLLAEVAKRVLSRQPRATPLELRDSESDSIGYLLSPADLQSDFYRSEQEFMNFASKRIAHRPERFLSIEEFFATLGGK